MECCRREGRTASEAIRMFIDRELGARPGAGRRHVPTWRVVAAGVIGAALGVGAAAPSFAHVRENSRAAFDRLDHNQDGQVSYQEFRSR